MSENITPNKGKISINPAPKSPEVKMKTAPVLPQDEEEVVTSDDLKDYAEEEKVAPPIAPVDKESQEDIQKQDTLDDLVAESLEAVDEGTKSASNIADAGLSVPVSTAEHLAEYASREAEANADRIAEVTSDLTSDIQKIYTATMLLTEQHLALLEALKNLEKKHPGVDPKTYLKRSKGGIGDSPADIFSQYRNEKVIDLDGYRGLMAMSALTSGGIRRITLWNSGIQVRLRSLPLDLLNSYQKEVSARAYEYGKDFGALYYRFNDLTISEYIIDRILPAAIVGSNYVHWKDQNALKRVISWQDYPVLLWAMGAMLHPNGVQINFVCANENCGHVHTEPNVDLNKLHLLNTDLINDDMIAHFKMQGAISDEQLEHYRNILDLKKTVEFSYKIDGVTKTWKVGLKQCSVYDYEAVGKDYNAELRNAMKGENLTNRSAVDTYMSYNDLRIFKPWIDFVELTMTRNNEEKTFRMKNVGTDVNTAKAFFTVLDEWQTHYPKFRQIMRDYILDTKISHIAYYYPKCPKCGQVPEGSYGGYVPYDSQYNFFILSLMRLYKNISQVEGASNS